MLKNYKKAYIKRNKPKSYALSKKVELQSKFSKINGNNKYKNNIYMPFYILHFMAKKVYKFEICQK